MFCTALLSFALMALLSLAARRLNFSPMALIGLQDPNFPDPTFSDFALFRIHKISLRLWH
jgi:hypothetical protein